MKKWSKKVYAAAGYNTVFMGPGRPEFNPSKPQRGFESYLEETAKGTLQQLKSEVFDEGVIGSFMSGRFINQANLPGFLPFMVPSLKGKACTGVEGACGTGGRAIAMAVRSILANISSSVFVAAFEMQNALKPIYGADVLAGASYYHKERKAGLAYFFPNIFAQRAFAYYQKYGEDSTRRGMAAWYQQCILNARKNPKAQEYYNKSQDLFSLAMTPPNPEKFIPYLNYYNCSKVTDGASSLAVFSEEGLLSAGIPKESAVEIVSMGEAEDDITLPPADPTEFLTTKIAVAKALEAAQISRDDIGVLELHDCFSITALLALEAIGFTPPGKSPAFILDGAMAPDGKIPTNLSGGLGGFGHPTGASGVRQMVDLWEQLTGKAPNPASINKPYGMMISMGGNDKTVTAFIVKRQ